MNEFGRYLLCVCEQSYLIILNAFMPGDEDGYFTHIAHNRSNAIAYFIIVRLVSHLNNYSI